MIAMDFSTVLMASFVVVFFWVHTVFLATQNASQVPECHKISHVYSLKNTVTGSTAVLQC